MARTPLPRHRFASAVTVALAVTVGTPAASPSSAAAPSSLAAAPAFAATAVAESTRQGVLPFPVDAQIGGAGPTGFLSSPSSTSTSTYRWTRYADGTTSELPPGRYASSWQTDTVTKLEYPVYTLYDMATDAEPVVMDISTLGEGYGHARSAGSSLVATRHRQGR
ncbi:MULTISPECIES: hypothetical protein [Streptomyces]|uniref:hypothetical protein n=1 Tax=Streptomyces TaxID=1883 RepID=UPI00093AD8CA|nr:MULTISPECIES: hypothetical protein [Streptomyces]MBX9423612.1 hypothetical protein [Streptomyces lateritius]OKJ68212.1 hypothetical protein AMK29_09310 [Streptomyces sp. CB02261]